LEIFVSDWMLFHPISATRFRVIPDAHKTPLREPSGHPLAGQPSGVSQGTLNEHE